MKPFLTTLLAFLLAHVATAQLELNVGLNGTFTSFRGPGAAPYTSVYSWSGSGTIESTSGGFYGTKTGIGWGFDFSAQRVMKKSGIVVGVSLGYERLNSRISIVEQTQSTPANQGNGSMVHSVFGFVNFFPYIGKRFFTAKGMLDASLGIETALPLSAAVRASGKTAFQIRKPDMDFRPRLQVKWQYKRYGALLAYSIGLYNYYGFLNGGKYQAYANVGRIGVLYSLLPKKSH